MVRQGKDKKRRAGRTGKTKLKNKNFKRWNPKPTFHDATVKKHWDPSKSPAANLASMGLTAKPNDMKISSVAGSNKAIELFDIPESDDLNSNRPKRVMPLTEEEQTYIAACMAKHGDNYKKMFMDIKVNDMQHTETQLKKLGSRFLLLDEAQRLVEVPNKVKDLVTSTATASK